MLLAESGGCRESLADLQEVQRKAEAQMETLAVRIGKTQSQLVALSAKQQLLRAQKLSAEGETLLARVDELMAGNQRLIAENPVRTVRELREAPTGKPEKPCSTRRVEAFLAAHPAERASDL